MYTRHQYLHLLLAQLREQPGTWFTRTPVLHTAPLTNYREVMPVKGGYNMPQRHWFQTGTFFETLFFSQTAAGGQEDRSMPLYIASCLNVVFDSDYRTVPFLTNFARVSVTHHQKQAVASRGWLVLFCHAAGGGCGWGLCVKADRCPPWSQDSPASVSLALTESSCSILRFLPWAAGAVRNGIWDCLVPPAAVHSGTLAPPSDDSPIVFFRETPKLSGVVVFARPRPLCVT